mmetsp:Transcript_69667/g.138129  ORF Transcript_69667/g.138129 Transcript_69667/m.138129 type:complete len:193 (-) Transcript_69667:587-1165(-)
MDPLNFGVIPRTATHTVQHAIGLCCLCVCQHVPLHDEASGDVNCPRNIECGRPNGALRKLSSGVTNDHAVHHQHTCKYASFRARMKGCRVRDERLRERERTLEGGDGVTDGRASGVDREATMPSRYGPPSMKIPPPNPLPLAALARAFVILTLCNNSEPLVMKMAPPSASPTPEAIVDVPERLTFCRIALPP